MFVTATSTRNFAHHVGKWESPENRDCANLRTYLEDRESLVDSGDVVVAAFVSGEGRRRRRDVNLPVFVSQFQFEPPGEVEDDREPEHGQGLPEPAPGPGRDVGRGGTELEVAVGGDGDGGVHGTGHHGVGGGEEVRGHEGQHKVVEAGKL